MKKERIERLPDPAVFPEGHRLSEAQSVPLENPVKAGSVTLQSIDLRPLRGKDVRKLEPGFEQLPGQIRLIGELSAHPDHVIEQLEGADLGAVLGRVSGLCWPAVDLPNLALDEDGDVVNVGIPLLVAPYELKFREPVKFTRGSESEASSAITFQAMTGKVAKRIPPGKHVHVSRFPWLIEQLTGAPPELVDALEGPDLREALGVAMCFFGSIQATGLGSGAF